MKAYGWKPFCWRDEEYGPASRFIGGRLKSRRKMRRILHKKGRSQGKRELELQKGLMNG